METAVRNALWVAVLGWTWTQALCGLALGEDLHVSRLPVVSSREEQPSLEERFDELEKALEDQKEDIDDLKSDLEKAVFPGHSKATMKVSGRIHLDYWSFPDTDSGINLLETGNPDVSPQDELGFRRLRFGVGGELPSNMEYRIDMEWAGGNDVEFRDAYLGWNDLPLLQTLLIGNQKRPYNLDQWNSSRHTIFMERPFIGDAFNPDARRFGIQSWGHSEDLRFNWQFGVFNQRNIQDEGIYLSDHLQPEYAGRWATTWWYDDTSNGRGYGHFAVSGALAHPDGSAGGDPDPVGSNRAQNEARFQSRPEARTVERWLDTQRIPGADWYKLAGVEGVLNIGPWQFVAEFQNVWLQRDTGFGPDLYFHGAYGYVAYFLTGEHMPWDRETGQLDRVVPFENFFLIDRCSGGVGSGWGAWQVALRYDYIDLTDQEIFGGEAQAVTFAVNWYWTPYARMQFNYIVGELQKRRFPDSDDPNAAIVGGDYQALGVRALVDF